MQKTTKTPEPGRKIGYAVAIFFLLSGFTILFSVLEGYNYNNYEPYCFLAVAWFSFLFLLFSFELHREKQDRFGDRFRNYRNLFWLVLFACCYTGIFWFLPDYSEPFIVIPIVVSLVITPYFGCFVSMAVILLYGLITEMGIYHSSYFLFLIFAGCLISEIFKQKKNWLLGLIMVSCITVVFADAFYYADMGRFTIQTFVQNAEGALASAAVLLICIFFVKRYVMDKEQMRMLQVMDESFVVRQRMQKHGNVYYKSAVYASKLCKNVAELIGADASLAEAAGFYYRVGELEGMEPEHGISIGMEFDFPKALMQILYEVRGELQLPSTKESGIAFIVYKIMKELKNVNITSAHIEREIAVHKTMNDLSVEGMLDNSGISMNQFLTIKDYLVSSLEEGVGYDN